jgi:hypothetical protein
MAAVAAAGGAAESSYPFITINADTNKFEVHDEAVRVLQAMQCPVAVVSVAGLYRTGKSYLLNLLKVRRMYIFIFFHLSSSLYPSLCLSFSFPSASSPPRATRVSLPCTRRRRRRRRRRFLLPASLLYVVLCSVPLLKEREKERQKRETKERDKRETKRDKRERQKREKERETNKR